MTQHEPIGRSQRHAFPMLLAVLVSLAVTAGLLVMRVCLGFDSREAAEAGDWVAGISSIAIQGVVIFLLYKTYVSQTTELAEQRKLLVLANNEAERKRFEDVFYYLLRRYEEVVQGLQLPDSNHYRARRVFRSLADECGSHLQEKEGIQAITKLFETRDYWLGDWVRVIYSIVRHVRESDRSDDEKLAYVKVFRGFLSSPELRVLLYHFATKTEDRSDTALFLLKNNFFKHVSFAEEKYRLRWASPRLFVGELLIVS